MSLIQRNATTCWKTIDMEYDLNASDSAIFIHLDPATCFVPQKISMFFEYKRQPWLSWVTIPLPVGNIPNSNEKIDYVHDNFKEIVVKWNDLNEQSLKNYKTFYDDFIKTRCTQMRIRFVYQDEGLDANIIGDFLTVNHKNSKNIIRDNNFRNTASSDQIIIYYDYEEVISALKNEY